MSELATTVDLKYRTLKAKTEQAEALLRMRQLDLARDERTEKRRLARLPLENTFNLYEGINDGSASQTAAWLEDRHLQGENKVEVRISSPGGSVFAGLALMDTMKYLRGQGLHITVVIQGMAASMAGIIAQAADHRVIAADSYLMIHTVSQGVFGRMETKDFQDEAELCKRLTLQGCKAYADRSGGKWTAEGLYEKTLRKDWWAGADEALENGFVDEVR